MLRKFLTTAFLLVIASTASLPHAFAKSVPQIVDRSLEVVSRATFLQWSLESLSISNKDTSCVQPYKKTPKGMRGAVCVLQNKGGAEGVFGKADIYTLNKKITRAEAVHLLMILTNTADGDTDVSDITDAKNDLEKLIATVAISHRWMLPLRAHFFGFNRVLTGTQAMSLLQAVTDEVPAATPKNISITIGNQSVTSGSLPNQDLLDAVWQLLQRDYLHSEKINRDELAYKIAEEIAQSSGDPYTNFFRPATAKNFNDMIKGELSGIGAQVEDKAGVVIVVSPIPGSPAQKAGLQTGDELLEADGHILTGIGVDQAVQYIRGKRGTSVTLKIRRAGTEIVLTIIRDAISIPEISVTWQGEVAVVQIVQFGETTQKKIRDIMIEIAKKNPKGIILDLRENGGGLLNAAGALLSNFLPQDTVVAQVRTATETSKVLTDELPITIADSVKMVVLVNKGSASASEITAGALQDYKRATIIGTTTFGKGTVQEILDFPNGEALKITVAEWLTPLGRFIQGKGIDPDIRVEQDGTTGDAQLKRALEFLR
jgi:carboxyl-terminal processing protease